MNARTASLFITLLSAAALLTACGAPSAETAARPTPVRVQPAITGPATPPIATNGTVVTKDEMRL